jgi:hypothetical protein
MWMSHPLWDTLLLLEHQLFSVPMSIHELRYLRKAFISVLATLLHGARSFWILRCTEVFQPASWFTLMSTTRFFPSHSSQLSISSFMSSLVTPGPWLSSFESDASGEDEDLRPEVRMEAMVDKEGEDLVHSSSAADPDFSHFVSVADLKRTPGASSFDFPCSVLGLQWATRDMQRPVRLVGQLPPPLPLPLPASGHPVRNSRVNMGYSADLALETNVNQVGLLPVSFEKVVVPASTPWGLPTTATPGSKTLTFARTGVRACSFRSFRVVHFRRAPLLGYTRAAIPTTFTFSTPKLTWRFATSDYALAAPRSSYLVDGNNSSSLSGPAWSNDNFELFNCYFAPLPLPLHGAHHQRRVASSVQPTRRLPTMTPPVGPRLTGLSSDEPASRRRPGLAASPAFLCFCSPPPLFTEDFPPSPG